MYIRERCFKQHVACQATLNYSYFTLSQVDHSTGSSTSWNLNVQSNNTLKHAELFPKFSVFTKTIICQFYETKTFVFFGSPKYMMGPGQGELFPKIRVRIFCEKGILFGYLVLLYDKIKKGNMWFNDSSFSLPKLVQKQIKIINTIYFLFVLIWLFRHLNYCNTVMKHEFDNNDKRTTIFLNNCISGLHLLVTLMMDLIFSELRQISLHFPKLQDKNCILLKIFNRLSDQKIYFLSVFFSCWF